MVKNLKRIERAIRKSIEQRLEEGYVIKPDLWGIDANGVWHIDETADEEDFGAVCAVGAYLLGRPRNLRNKEHAKFNAGIAAGKYLGTRGDEIAHIIEGFDMDPSEFAENDGWEEITPFKRLGHQLRLDYYET